MGSGRLGGPSSPVQNNSVAPGKPASAKVGTSGSKAERREAATAIGRTLPDLT